jgi:CRISPR/Cas system-associated exonuclease Cas4 (RecB family)
MDVGDALMGITRQQLWVALGFARPVESGVGLDSLTERAYREQGERVHRENLDAAPHGQQWHTSFHASQFPPEVRPCGRKAMYELMGIPPEKPAEPWLVAVADAGKDIEVQIVRRWQGMGWLLSAPPDSEFQTSFVDPDTWLSCSIDAALDLRSANGYDAVLPADVKGKDHDVVTQIRSGRRGPDEGHVRQVLVQTALCRMHHEEMGWDKLGLKPAKGASLLYVSRQRPGHRHEVYVEWDEERFDAGVRVLREWRRLFEAGELPPRVPAWKWTEAPCRWCDFKEVCKFDLRKGVEKLGDSTAIAMAQDVRPSYDFETAIAAVLERWKSHDSTKGGTHGS